MLYFNRLNNKIQGVNYWALDVLFVTSRQSQANFLPISSVYAKLR